VAAASCRWNSLRLEIAATGEFINDLFVKAKVQLQEQEWYAPRVFQPATV
jgi:hypothetical protein